MSAVHHAIMARLDLLIEAEERGLPVKEVREQMTHLWTDYMSKDLDDNYYTLSTVTSDITEEESQALINQLICEPSRKFIHEDIKTEKVQEMAYTTELPVYHTGEIVRNTFMGAIHKLFTYPGDTTLTVNTPYGGMHTYFVNEATV